MGGESVFTTREGKDVMDVIESIAGSAEVTEDIVLQASNRILGKSDELVVEHDMQTAFVFQPFSSYHRAAILQRRDRKAGSFAISVYHPVILPWTSGI